MKHVDRGLPKFTLDAKLSEDERIRNEQDRLENRAKTFWKSNLPDHFVELEQRLGPFLTKQICSNPFPWLRAARRSLMLTAETVATRAGVTRNAFNAAEKAECEGTITLEILSKYAQAMDCELVYAIRPKSCETFGNLIWKALREEACQHAKTFLKKEESPKAKFRKELLATSIMWEKPMVRRKRKWTNREPV